jgi:hypothetical protein
MSSVKEDVVAVFESDYSAPVVTDLDNLVQLPGENPPSVPAIEEGCATNNIVQNPKKRRHDEGGVQDPEEPAPKKLPTVRFDMKSSRQHLAEWNQRVADAEMLREWEASMKQMRKTMEALQRSFRKNHPVTANIGENKRFNQLATFLEMIDASVPIVFMDPRDRTDHNLLEISFDLETRRLSFANEDLQQLWLEKEFDYVVTRESSVVTFNLEARVDAYGSSYYELVSGPRLFDSDVVDRLILMEFGEVEPPTEDDFDRTETVEDTYDLLILTKK